MLRHDIMEKTGYFSDQIYRQEMDDHCKMYEVYEKYRLKCGVFPIEFKSDLNWGSTRENGKTKPWLLMANHRNMKHMWKQHKESILAPKHDEERILK